MSDIDQQIDAHAALLAKVAKHRVATSGFDVMLPPADDDVAQYLTLNSQAQQGQRAQQGGGQGNQPGGQGRQQGNFDGAKAHAKAQYTAAKAPGGPDLVESQLLQYLVANFGLTDGAARAAMRQADQETGA